MGSSAVSFQAACIEMCVIVVSDRNTLSSVLHFMWHPVVPHGREQGGYCLFLL